MKSEKEVLNNEQKLNGLKKILYAFIPKRKCSRHIFTWVTVTFLINALIMYLNPLNLRDDISNPFMYYLTRVVLNSGIFISVGAILFFFKNRNVYFALYSILWIGLSIVNNILMEVRNTPLTKYDFGMLSVGANVAKDFLNDTHYFKICVFIVISILTVYITTKKSKYSKRYSISNAFASFVYINVLSSIFTVFMLSSNSPHINNYEEYGFVYGFKENLMTPEFKKPYGYKDSTIQDIKNNIDKLYSANKISVKPNIIAVQLESYLDPKEIEGLKLSENPTPFFDKLKKNYTSGYLKVPTVGGGTARTEFEFITGMNIDLMADGIIPHNRILKDKPFISSVYPMKNSGYTSHFIHNFGGYFYDRDIAYNNLGFDTFTSLEFLENATIDPNLIKGSRDSIFANEIHKRLTNTKGPDFIFNVTAQLHGNYDSDYKDYENNIKAEGNFSKTQLSQFNDYVNEIKSVDDAIRDIVKTVESINEPSIIIFYSDHLPPLNYSKTGIVGEKQFKAPYVVWDNLGFEKKDTDIESYEILSKYMYLSGIEGNYINKLQSLNIPEDLKSKYQGLVQYDLSKGENYLKESNMPSSNGMILGSSELNINSVDKDGITYIFKGSGFTPMTKLIVDDNICGIEFVDKNTIKFTTNLDLTGKTVYLKIQIGQNEDSVLKSNMYKVK